MQRISDAGSQVVLNLSTGEGGRFVPDISEPRLAAVGVMPELEIFDSGDMQLARHLVETGVLNRPSLFRLVLGVRFGAPANPETLFYLTSQVPAGSVWAAFGIGRHEFRCSRSHGFWAAT